MPPKIIRDDFEKFHDYGCLLPERIIYFGSETDGDDGESGVEAISSRRIIKNLIFLEKKSHDPIIIHWNSPGGCWMRGMAIYDVIKSLKSPVEMIGYGMVRSMGTIIMQSCDVRLLSPNCDFMVHDGEESMWGVPKNNDIWTDWSKYTREKMYDIYMKKIMEKNPTFPKGELKDKCTIDWILKPQEAVELGLADRVL